jgi:hypothetical protein
MTTESTQPAFTKLIPGTLVVCATRMPSIDQPWIHDIYIGVIEAPGTDLSWNGRNTEAHYCEVTGTARVSYAFGKDHDRVCDLMPITAEQAALIGRERVLVFMGAVPLWQLERYNHKTHEESEAYWKHLEDFVPPGTLVICKSSLPSPSYPWREEIRIGTVEAPETDDEAARCQSQNVVRVRYDEDAVQHENIGTLMPITAEQAALGTREKIAYFLGAVAAWKYDQHMRERE